MFRMKSKNFLTGMELSRQELMDLLFLAESCREQRMAGFVRDDLRGKSVVLLFEKPSLRTRVSFAVAVQELGGNVIELNSSLKKSEEPEDTIRVLNGYAHAVMVRTHNHSILDRMAAKATLPLINGLSDTHHPCQVLADLLTLLQHYKDLKGLKLAYVGDGNNMLHSLLLLAPFMGIDLHFACPPGYGPNSLIVRQAKKRALAGEGNVVSHTRVEDAVAGAQAVYTDVWTSMGFEDDVGNRDQIFADYALTKELYSLSQPGALIMHCMPMVRDKEIAGQLVEHECSVIFRQSENRMHAQKALLIGLMGK